MCDYSAGGVQHRDAKTGERLVTGSISYHTIGFRSPKDPGVAVCALPGMEITLSGIPEEIQKRYGVGPESTATFRKIEPGNTIPRNEFHLYRDAVEFPNGELAKLMELGPGVHAEVLKVPVITPEEHERLYGNVDAFPELEQPWSFAGFEDGFADDGDFGEGDLLEPDEKNVMPVRTRDPLVTA